MLILNRRLIIDPTTNKIVETITLASSFKTFFLEIYISFYQINEFI